MLKRMQNSLEELDDSFEIGGSYFELIEFSLLRRLPDGRDMIGTYGINVAKVREVVHMPKINPLASRVSGIAGIFELRGIPIPAVNLCAVLGDFQSPITHEQQIIVTEFSQKRAGFIVHATNRIRRVTWDKVLPPSTDSSSSITGMMLIEDNEFLFILDLENIISQLENQAHGAPPSSAAFQNQMAVGPSGTQAPIYAMQNAGGPTVLLVDDSNLILANVSKALSQAGFYVLIARDGLEALDILDQAAGGRIQAGPIKAIVTDVEMPQMDGLSLVSRVRKHQIFGSVPIYLHTSLSDNSSIATAEKAGANGFFVKNDVKAIIDTLKSQLQNSRISA